MDYAFLIDWGKDHALTVVAVVITLVLIYHYVIEKDKGVKLSKKYRNSIFEAQSRIFLNATQYLIEGNKDLAIKEFLNVEGFEKYTFTLNLTSFDKGEKNKVLTASETVTGRTQADALLKVKKFFNDYIEQNLSDLHLD